MYNICNKYDNYNRNSNDRTISVRTYIFFSFYITIKFWEQTRSTWTTALNSLWDNDKLKHQIKTLVDNGTNAAIVIGLVDSNGTQFYGYGKTSNVTNATVVNENTIFDIGSITKTFTTTILADTVNRGVLKLKDPIENFLSFYN